MKKKKHVIKKNKSQVNVMTGERQTIFLMKLEAKIMEKYEADADTPVYVHYLPDGCSIKGATMVTRISQDYLLAEQVYKEVETKLQKQSIRVLDHSLKIKENLIVLDSLETGSLRIYKPNANDLVRLRHSSDECSIKSATLVGRIDTNILLKEETVIIDDVYCKYGYEELAEPMIEQVQHFVDFYKQFNKLGITDSAYQKWILKEA